MELISIIVPAYNVEKYIGKCVDSILRQNYTNFELLLIDDGSTDSTAFLCDTYAQRDSRVKCFHKTNGGLSDARNYGLERMTGKYVTFIDGDDYVSDSYISNLVRMISIESDIQIAMIPGQMLRESDSPVNDKGNDIEVLSAVDAMKKMMLRQNITHTSWGKLFTVNLWDDIRFPVGQNYEDYATTYHVFLHAKKVAYSFNRLYYYIQHDNSIMHQACSKKTLSVLDVSDTVTDDIIKKCRECQIEARALQTAVYLKNMQSILNTGLEAFPSYQKRIVHMVKRNVKSLLSAKQVPRNDKVKILLLMINKRLFLKVYNLRDGDIFV